MDKQLSPRAQVELAALLDRIDSAISTLVEVRDLLTTLSLGDRLDA